MITSLPAVENCRRSTLDTPEESPLEVLSRAATMVRQESQQVTSDETNKQQKQTTKWKRDRRRLPEYSRKSDPKVPETLGVEPSSPEASVSNGSSPRYINEIQLKREQQDSTSHYETDTPLDMTVRNRGSPPSYDQTINNPGYRSNFHYRPTVIHNGVPPVSLHQANNRDELPSGISMCDPVIEEHFRRSLGQDYHTIFPSKEKDTPTKPAPKVATNQVIEFMGESGLSVDDHFAKALGDTWKQLNNKKEEIKNRESETNLVTAKN
ncbi:uncharacterized protein LOC126746527 [Anthonomus grandis grandis]|uniref:uncharacterized protein LOC126746527 n=1 Tax=Anthonomus grandis grandis TaxID=2921223 RepID=UPI002166920D|nr:uncharacterized protein LOC126746527 [Anthonomus grandis grandis]